MSEIRQKLTDPTLSVIEALACCYAVLVVVPDLGHWWIGLVIITAGQLLKRVIRPAPTGEGS